MCVATLGKGGSSVLGVFWEEGLPPSAAEECDQEAQLIFSLDPSLFRVHSSHCVTSLSLDNN